MLSCPLAASTQQLKWPLDLGLIEAKSQMEDFRIKYNDF